jgi:magnesium transporter
MNRVLPRRAESAEEHIVACVPRVGPDATGRTVVELLCADVFDALDAVFVVDAEGTLLGAAQLTDVLRAPREAPMRELMDASYPRVSLHHDQEHVASEALRARATSVAVVDRERRLIGAVPALSLLAILNREHVEDLHRLAGIQRERVRDLRAIEDPPARRARHRLPWLLVGVAGSMLAAIVVSSFEAILAGNLAVAYFVPVIVYLADAIGTQSEAIAVRGLSVSRLGMQHLLLGELRTGLLIGITLAGLVWLVAAPFAGVSLALAVALSIGLAGMVATSLGLLLPWLLQRMGSDPAFGSGPVATVIQDVLSLIIYFSIASAILE